MTAFLLNHVGILVPDIEAAIDHYSKTLGATFLPATKAQFARVEEDDSSGPCDLWLTFSTNGPPHIELLQATGTGVWRAEQGFGLHHIGGHGELILPELERLKVRPEARIYKPDGTLIITYFKPEDLGGARYEIVSSELKPHWDSWISGGPGPGQQELT